MAVKKNKITYPRVLVSCGTKFHADYMAFQLDKAGLLDKVITAHPPSRFLNRTALKKNKTKFIPPLFAVSYFIQKLLRKPNAFTRYLDTHLPLVYDKIAAKFTGKANISITWAWAGLNTIKAIKKNGGIAIVEECGSCNTYQNELLAGEYAALNLTFANPTPQIILDREMEEVNAADYILCPSRHVANSFAKYGINADKFKIIPYGVNLELFKPIHIKKEKFTILFVGTIGVRKGLIYLFRALEILKPSIDVDCILIGTVEEQFEGIVKQYNHLFTHIERVEHHQLQTYYGSASVFVFPSLDEGMAYVQLEAMACGLPVICTPNSGGDSVIDDTVEGYIVPVRDAKAIADKITTLYNNPVKREQMSTNAQTKANKFSWDAYGVKLAEFIKQL